MLNRLSNGAVASVTFRGGTKLPEQRTHHSPGRPKTASTTKNAIVSAAGGLLNAGLSAAILAICARDGQNVEIAAYTVMGSVLAFVSIAAGGGGPLLYVSSGPKQRAAIQQRWILVVLPSLLAGVAMTCWIYVPQGYTLQALLYAAIIAVGNNVTQFQLADLTRDLRFMASALTMSLSKLAGLALVIGGVELTPALVVSTLLQYFAGELILGSSSWIRSAGRIKLSFRVAFSKSSLSGDLFGFTAAELYNGRIAAVALSFMVTSASMGVFSAIISVYQAVSGVFDIALRAPMAAKIRARQGLGHSDAGSMRSEVLLVSGVTAASFILFALAPWLTDDFLRLDNEHAASWLRIFATTIPFMAVRHVVVFDRVAQGLYREARQVSYLTAAIVTVVLAFGVPLFHESGAAFATLTSEAAIAVGVLIVARSRSRTSDTQMQTRGKLTGASRFTGRL